MDNGMLKTVRDAGFTIKGLKTWTAREGYGFSFSLLFKGKKVAVHTQDGNGGMGRTWWEQGTKEVEAAFDAIVKSLPPVEYGSGMGLEGETYEADEDHVMAALSDEFDLISKVKRAAKKGKTMWTVGDKIWTGSAPFTPEYAKIIMAKYPGAVILNEVYATA